MIIVSSPLPPGQAFDRTIEIVFDGRVYHWLICLAPAWRLTSTTHYLTRLDAIEAAVQIASAYDATPIEPMPADLARRVESQVIAEVRRTLGPNTPQDLVEGTAAHSMGERFCPQGIDWAVVEDDQIGD